MRSRSTSPQFVGRAEELRVLDECLEESRNGDLITALVCGEAGSGKTRLVNEVAAVASTRGTRTLVGSCTTVGGTSLAFAPFAEAIRPVVQELSIDRSDGTFSPAPRFARLLAAPLDETATGTAPGVDPLRDFAQLRLYEEVLDTLERAAVPSGLLLVIEDLHWADLSSRGVFEFLSRNLRGTPIALVGTVRTDEPDTAGFLAWLAEVQRGPQVLRIDLERFDREELVELLTGVLGHPPLAEQASRIYELSGGNAFLAEELLAAHERGIVVPGTAQGLVLARIAGLSAQARDVIRLAAVAGVRVDHGLLAAASGLEDEALLAAARELADKHLLVTDRSGDGYAFRHALTREAVSDDLLPGERQRFHHAVARVLTENPALGPTAAWAQAEAVAEHWFGSGDLERALPAAIAAGDAAREVVAVADALRHYERALELWDRVAEPRTFAGVERCDLLARAAEVASWAGEHDRSIRYIDAAIAAHDRTATTPEQLALLYAQKCPYLWRAGRVADLLEWTERATALLPHEPPTPGRAAVLAEQAHALSLAERYEDAIRVAEAALEAARRADARKQEAIGRTALGVCLLMTTSDPDAGIRELERVTSIGREIGDAEEVVYGYAVLAYSLITLGRLDEAVATGLEAVDVGVELGAPRSWAGLGTCNGAEALFLAGRWNECDEVLGLLHEERCGGLVELIGLALAALLDASRGRDDVAVAAMSSAERLGVEHVQAEGLLRATRSQLAVNTGDLQAAHQAALDGLDILMRSQSQPEVAAIVTLADLGLRIAADRAQVARARRDLIGERSAVESAGTVAEQSRTLWARACAAAHRPSVMRAHGALCDAEVSRAEGRSDPDLWCRVAGAEPPLGGPHLEAYAEFREAEAMLASRGDRARAVGALIAANATACELGAEPLRREIEALARRARIGLADDSRPSQSPTRPEPLVAPLGLTARELEVLELLAAGYTNPQIGEALYISRKTASHHVSSVLTKLGVKTRVEAAGVAHRLGLTSDSSAPI